MKNKKWLFLGLFFFGLFICGIDKAEASAYCPYQISDKKKIIVRVEGQKTTATMIEKKLFGWQKESSGWQLDNDFDLENFYVSGNTVRCPSEIYWYGTQSVTFNKKMVENSDYDTYNVILKEVAESSDGNPPDSLSSQYEYTCKYRIKYDDSSSYANYTMYYNTSDNSLLFTTSDERAKFKPQFSVSDIVKGNYEDGCPDDLFFNKQDFDNIRVDLTDPGLIDSNQSDKTGNKPVTGDDLYKPNPGTGTTETPPNRNSGGCNILPPKVWEIISTIFNMIRIIVPILLILLGAADMGKVVLSGEQDEMKKSTNKLIKRCIMAASIFFVPLILGYIIDVSGIDEVAGSICEQYLK